ncbi:MAG: esterase family protein [Treponema sp.]|jgi:S-formylglutathione hydrolase FrmB|nr:esterase family protein [Treponema sp.]
MSFFTGTIYSKSMNMDTSLAVLLPQDSRKHRSLEESRNSIKPPRAAKTLILLHGYSDGYSAWLTRSSIARYAEDYDIAVLMPEVQHSFYQDMKNGLPYFSYITGELPRLASEMFNISTAAEDCMIAGLSMGGYGALYAGLTYPERFYGVGCFSSAFDLRAIAASVKSDSEPQAAGWDNDLRGIFGESPVFSEKSDLFILAEKNAKAPQKPKIYISCGTEDFLYQSNTAMRDLLSAQKYDLKYEEWPGTHEWGFWDLSVQKMLEHFLPAPS